MSLHQRSAFRTSGCEDAHKQPPVCPFPALKTGRNWLRSWLSGSKFSTPAYTNLGSFCKITLSAPPSSLEGPCLMPPCGTKPISHSPAPFSPASKNNTRPYRKRISMSTPKFTSHPSGRPHRIHRPDPVRRHPSQAQMAGLTGCLSAHVTFDTLRRG